MKITYIISEIDKAVYFENTAESLRSEGFDVNYILINCRNGALDQFLQAHDFKVVNVECLSLRQSWNAIKICKRELKKHKTTLIHCHLSTANWVGLWAGKLARVQTRIYTRHSGKPIAIHWKEKIIDKIQNKLSTKIIAITEVIKEYLITQNVHESKVALIHHGFDLKEFENCSSEEIERIKNTYNSGDNYPVIGVIARRMEWKGIQYTIAAFKRLLVEYPNAKLCLFGGGKNGDFELQIEQLLATIASENKLIVSYENNVFALYSLFDVHVHVPFNYNCEAFGQTYVESLAAGCPSVFTLSGIANEFIQDQENALVVPFKNEMAIFEGMKTILENKELTQIMILNGKQSVLPFSFELHIDKLKKLYHG